MFRALRFLFSFAPPLRLEQQPTAAEPALSRLCCLRLVVLLPALPPPSSLPQLRFEDLRDAFEPTLEAAAGALGLRDPAGLAAAAAAEGCDPGLWSPEERARDKVGGLGGANFRFRIRRRSRRRRFTRRRAPCRLSPPPPPPTHPSPAPQHITAGKVDVLSLAALEDALLGHAPARRALCALAVALGYGGEPRCARWRAEGAPCSEHVGCPTPAPPL